MAHLRDQVLSKCYKKHVKENGSVKRVFCRKIKKNVGRMNGIYLLHYLACNRH